MLTYLRAAGRFVRDKIGWNRVGFVLSLAIISIALTVLYRMLRGIDLEEVIDAAKATEWRDIALAAFFVACGYFTLTFYDLFALRTIGKAHVPYRTAALSGFSSYSIGHNIGATVFTGGAVRYRIYSAYGLTAIDIAKLSFVAGLTFWLGNATMLGIGILIEPSAASAIDQLAPSINRILAVGILSALFSYIAWVWKAPRVIGRGGWLVRLPDGPLTLLQILIGITDLICCSLAMYMLLPGDPHVDFITLTVIFVSATLLGFASHAPGGLGVFDAAMLVALWQFDREDLVAGLLLFRVLYYICPFVLAVTLLGVREIVMNLRSAPQPATPDPKAGQMPAITPRSGNDANDC